MIYDNIMGRKKEKLMITDLRIGDMVVVSLNFEKRVTRPMKVVGIMADGNVHLDDGDNTYIEDVRDLRIYYK